MRDFATLRYTKDTSIPEDMKTARDQRKEIPYQDFIPRIGRIFNPSATANPLRTHYLLLYIMHFYCPPLPLPSRLPRSRSR
jgi:hypothetical protein